MVWLVIENVTLIEYFLLCWILILLTYGIDTLYIEWIKQLPTLYRSEELRGKAMRKQLVLIIPILAAIIGMLAIVGLNSVNAQNMTTPETNYTSGTNATSGNMTSGNATSDNMAGPTNTTTP